jgi:hypothetical protein
VHIFVPNNPESHHKITCFVSDAQYNVSVALHYLFTRLAINSKKHMVYGYIGHVVITGYIGHVVITGYMGHVVITGYIGHVVITGYIGHVVITGYMGHVVITGYIGHVVITHTKTTAMQRVSFYFILFFLLFR